MNKFLFVWMLLFAAATGNGQGTEPQVNFIADYQGFFRNNEYFEDYLKGYTLTGNHFTPQIELQLSESASIKTGAHLLKYNGLDDFSEAVPFLSVELTLNKFGITLGSFSEANRMKLSDKLFSDERSMTNYLQEGLLIKYHSKQFNVETWLDWEQFIFRNDPFREEFMVGSVMNWQTHPGNETVFEADFQSVIQHKGGQVDDSGLPVNTVMNNALGLFVRRHRTHERVLSFGVRAMLYNDLNGNAEWSSENGWALDFPLSFRSEKLRIKAGYWTAEEFVAPYGKPVFQTVSLAEPRVSLEENSVAYFDFSYNYEVIEGLKLQARLSNYYMIDLKGFNYYYGVTAILNQKFFITTLKKAVE